MLDIQERDLKPLLRELLHELLVQERDLLREVIGEVMEDEGLARAIAEGKEGESVSREEIFALLEED